MKYSFILLVISSLLHSAILGGPHDLSSGSATDDSELCIYCHPNSLPSEVNTSSFTLYTTDTNTTTAFINATFSCLSCHDGVLAINQDIHPLENLVYLDRMHPVEITYNEQKYSLRNKNTPITNWNNATTIDDILVNGEVKCVTCHNPHDNQLGTFLRHTNYASSLCTTCHVMSEQ